MGGVYKKIRATLSIFVPRLRFVPPGTYQVSVRRTFIREGSIIIEVAIIKEITDQQ